MSKALACIQNNQLAIGRKSRSSGGEEKLCKQCTRTEMCRAEKNAVYGGRRRVMQ